MLPTDNLSRHPYATVMSGLRTQIRRIFLDRRTNSESVAHEKLQTWTDADRFPLISSARILFYL